MARNDPLEAEHVLSMHIEGSDISMARFLCWTYLIGWGVLPTWGTSEDEREYYKSIAYDCDMCKYKLTCPVCRLEE